MHRLNFLVVLFFLVSSQGWSTEEACSKRLSKVAQVGMLGGAFVLGGIATQFMPTFTEPSMQAQSGEEPTKKRSNRRVVSDYEETRK